MTLTEKILQSHLHRGTLERGKEAAIRVDQALINDTGGTQICLQFEALGLPAFRVPLTVIYCDHNAYHLDQRYADDHRFLQSAAARFGAVLARAGSGICHQIHRERFAAPGKVLLGCDSHTPTAGGLGMFAVAQGGMDVTLALAAGHLNLPVPAIVNVRLTGRLRPWASAKDVILALLRDLTVQGGNGKVFEYTGPGVASLSIAERCTIANMGTELGATTSIFPSDERTRDYLERQGRGEDWQPLSPDPGAVYDQVIELDLSQVEPLLACPQSPDRVRPVKELRGLPVKQVVVGSCTNGSYEDMAVVAEILKGKRVHPEVDLVVAPASRRSLETLAQEGLLPALLAAGATISESTCGPCIGQGHVPPTDAVSLRTFNRNFAGRSGIPDDQVYLCSPETAALAALYGRVVDPEEESLRPVSIRLPERFASGDGDLDLPQEGGDPGRELVRGPHIAPVPLGRPVPDTLEGEVLIKVGDNVTTDHILPATPDLLSLRSNVPQLAEYTLLRIDPDFARRAKEKQGGIIVAGRNYGQGSAREHAAICPMVLGVRAVVAQSFARIHRRNLINWGIIPLTFERPEDLEAVGQGDVLALTGLHGQLSQGGTILLENRSRGTTIPVRTDLQPRELEILLDGGLLNHVRKSLGDSAA